MLCVCSHHTNTTMSPMKGTVDPADGNQALFRSRLYGVLVLVLANLIDTKSSCIP